MSAILFLDGRRGNCVLYTTVDGLRKYVYRGDGGQLRRVYVKQGESVAWIECDADDIAITREEWQQEVIAAAELARPNFPWHKVRESEFAMGWMRKEDPQRFAAHLLVLVSTGETVQRRCRR